MPTTPCKWYNICPMKRFYEEGRVEKELIEKYCLGDYKKCKRYQVVEKGEFCPDYVLPNGKVDEKLKA